MAGESKNAKAIRDYWAEAQRRHRQKRKEAETSKATIPRIKQKCPKCEKWLMR